MKSFVRMRLQGRTLLLNSVLMSLACSMLSGCLKQGNVTIALPEIGTASNVIPDEIRDEFESKMDIYEGANPPDITCSFVIAECELYYSSDGYVSRFADDYMKFYDKRGNRYKFKERQSNTHSESTDVIVIGSGDNFTAYFTNRTEYDDDEKTWTITSTLISGTMSSDGIRNIRHAFIMLDKYDPEDKVMDVNEYRIFVDGDGFASFNEWDYTKSVQSTVISSEGESTLAKLNK